MSEHKHHPTTNTHILVQEFDYLAPASLREAIELASEYDERAQFLAGGTNLFIWMKMEHRAPEMLIDISRLPGLKGISFQDGHVEIGSLTTIRALCTNTDLWSEYTALGESCAAFGFTQIQIMGTIGGNLCNGSPASDTVPALMALDAQLVLAGPDGERTIPVDEFLVGPGKVALRTGELLTSVQLQRPKPGAGSAFIKLARVEADLAKVNVAAALVRDGERVTDCRLAFGAVGPTIIRARKAEKALIGQPFSAGLALEVGSIAAEEISPIDDVRSTAWYRREVTKAITHDALQLAWQRAGEKGEESLQPATRDTQPAIRNSLRVPRDTKLDIELTVNGVRHQLAVKPNDLLLNILREQLALTGSKYGCGIGECGACTVHLNGEPVLGCLVLAIAADGAEVLTIEGLQGPNGELDPLQEAFIEKAAFQCGYCTPGMLMLSKSLLNENPSPTEDEVRDHLKGNRCRCTGFTSIVRAVTSCAQEQSMHRSNSPAR